MAKVELDYSQLRSQCIIELDDAISSLDKALNYYAQISIPSDFPMKNSLINTKENLKNQRKRLVDIKSWIVSSNSNYDSLMSNLVDQANKLPTYKVTQRNNIV